MIGAGEGPFHMAEEFAFQQTFIERRAVDLDERLLVPFAQAVDGAGDQFLAGARLPIDNDRCLRPGNAFHQVEDATHHWGVADNALKALVVMELLFKGGDFLFLGNDVAEIHQGLQAAYDFALVVADERSVLQEMDETSVLFAENALAAAYPLFPE